MTQGIRKINKVDVIEQARWELDLEYFEQAVEQEKVRIRAKRAWFPWRIKIVKLNKED